MTTEFSRAADWGAHELALAVPPSISVSFAHLSREEMVASCIDLQEHLTKGHWLLADALATIVARAGARMTDRARSLKEFCFEIHMDEKYGREHVRVALAVPPEKREEFPALGFGHWRELVRHSARDTEPLPDRIERIYALAAQVDDEGLGVRAAARLARETAHSNGRQMEPPEEQPANRQEELQNQRLAEETERREASEREVEALKASIAVLERDLEAARAKPALTDEEMSELLQALETEGYWQRRRWGLELLLAAQRLLAPDFHTERHLPDYLRRAVSVATRLAGSE